MLDDHHIHIDVVFIVLPCLHFDHESLVLECKCDIVAGNRGFERFSKPRLPLRR